MPDSAVDMPSVRHRVLLAAGNVDEQAHLACSSLLRQAEASLLPDPGTWGRNRPQSPAGTQCLAAVPPAHHAEDSR